MRHNTFVWLGRIKGVEREYLSARLAADRLAAAVEADPASFLGGLAVRDIRQMREQLEGTYLIRLYSEFEAGLRLFWPTARGTDPPTRTRDLLDGLAATCRIPHAVLVAAHAVRDYRNRLVHVREDAVEPIPLAEARKRLCIFFAFLPPEWE